VNVRFIYLDAAGTILRPWPSVGAVYAGACRPFGLAASAEDVETAFRVVWADCRSKGDDGMTRAGTDLEAGRRWWRQFMNRIFDTLHFNGDRDGCLEVCYQRFSQADAWQVFPDVLPAIHKMRQRGLGVGVLSNWDARLPSLLQALGLKELFSTVVVSALEGVAKPEPALFARAALQAGYGAQSILHVGDDPQLDLDAARAAGFHSLLVDREGCFGLPQSISSLHGILNWLDDGDASQASC
jgi:putative hydrolase of the HAD superfamily